MDKSQRSRQTTIGDMGLHFSSDSAPGIKRAVIGKGFDYFLASGQRITDRKTLDRIKSLVIPPAWEKVWICPHPRGHLQATGRDAKNRKQYRYHCSFRKHQDDTKFSTLRSFALALPRLRRNVNRHLNLKGLPRDKVLATVVSLLERTLIRVGNQEYAEHNHSFGLSTLENKHVQHCGNGMRFMFVGKSGVRHDVEVTDQRLAKIVFGCRDLPGQHLFEFQDEAGKVHGVNSADVNAYIQECSKANFSAKHFRTWRGTVLALTAIERCGTQKTILARKKTVSSIIRDVAAELRNTPATCRKYYVHPLVIGKFMSGLSSLAISHAREEAHQHRVPGLSLDENVLLKFLKRFDDKG